MEARVHQRANGDGIIVPADIAGALESLLAKNSYGALTIDRIADEAGVPQTYIRSYAHDKEALVAAISERLSLDILESVTAVATSSLPATQRLQTMIRQLLRWFASSPYRHVVRTALYDTVPIEVHARASAPLQKIYILTADVLVSGARAGEFRVLHQQELSEKFITNIVHTSIISLLDNPDKIDNIEKEACDFILLGLGAGFEGY